MSFEITGKLIQKYDTIQRTETFKIREFVIEKTDDINGRIISNYIKFQCVQDRTSLPDKYNVGDEIKVLFNIKGTKWIKEGKENYFTNLDAWRIEHIKLSQEMENNHQSSPVSEETNELNDDLPF